MATEDLLSQDEIDALLDAVADGDLQADDHVAGVDEGDAETYDFTAPARIIRGFTPTLEMINERFVNGFRLTLFNLVQQYAEVTPGGIQVLGLSEYLDSLPTPTSINTMRVKPLRGTALVVIEAHLVSTLVNAFFGGSGRVAVPSDRPAFTTSEMRIVQRMLGGLFADLRDAWSSVMALEFEPGESETNPKYTNVRGAGDTESMVVNVINVALEGGGGAFHVLMPFSMFEPLRERLTAHIQHVFVDPDQRFGDAMLEGVGDAEVEVHSKLLYVDVTISELMNLKKGDVIPVQVPPSVTLDVDDTPVYRGVYGSLRNVCAVQITGAVSRN